MSKVTARVRVQVTVEMDVPDVWGGECPMSQIHKQAQDSALNALRGGLIIHGLQSSEPVPLSRVIAKVIGQAKVEAVVVSEECDFRLQRHTTGSTLGRLRLQQAVIGCRG